jgi:hypothetical protein
VHPPTPPVGSTITPAQREHSPAAPAPAHAPHGEPTIDPLDEAAAAIDRGPSSRSRRKEARSEARARRRAEKQARKDAEREAREQAEEESIAEQAALDAEAAATAEQTATAEAAPVEPDPVEHAAAEAAPVEAVAEHPGDDASTDEDQGRRLVSPDALVARLPAIHPLAAAIISGALAGLAAVGLAFGAASGCESIRGTGSCGGGIGLLALVAILAIEVLIGANLLKAWQISDPFSTSFLGVGLVATLAMLIFLDDLDSSWMLLVIPLMTAVAFALSWWVTVRFIDEYETTSEVDSELGESDSPEETGPVPTQDEAQKRDSNA